MNVINNSLSENSTPIKIPVMGVDPSLNNWGFSYGYLYMSPDSTPSLEIEYGQVIQNKSKPSKVKQPKNVIDMNRASEIYIEMLAHLKEFHPSYVFIELPYGSQSSRAMMSAGLCTGVMGSLVGGYNTRYEVVTPRVCKKVTVGTHTASKEEMIEWVVDNHPEYELPTRMLKGERVINSSQAEHIADSIAAIHAGIINKTYKSIMEELKDSL